jgi:hypothetical protein
MRMRDALALLSVAMLAACSGKPAGQVKMMGLTPNTGLQKDTREIRCTCPSCGTLIEAEAPRCPDKNCKATLNWDEKYRCGFCSGTGVCQACFLMEKTGGKCFNCKGKGFITFQGRTPDCPDCKKTGVCTICKGTQKCDYCGGSKEIAIDVIKAKARKPGAGKEESVEEKKPAPPAPSEKKEEKKEEEKK